MYFHCCFIYGSSKLPPLEVQSPILFFIKTPLFKFIENILSSSFKEFVSKIINKKILFPIKTPLLQVNFSY